MSNRSQPQRKTAKTPTSQNARQNLSQRTLDERFINSQAETSESFEDNVNNVVRYIVYNAGSNLPIKKLEIQKHVIPGSGRQYEKIMTKAIKVLKEVYGFDLHLCDQPVSNKQYVVKNLLPYKRNINEDKPTEEEGKQILILLVLTHVFMSGNNTPEDTLFKFLQSLEIDPFSKSELFGNIKEFITNDMVKQRYLSVTLDEHTRKSNYSWGTKAEVDVSKTKILQFVCNIYGNCQPTSWKKQFEMANEQCKEQSNATNTTTEAETASMDSVIDDSD